MNYTMLTVTWCWHGHSFMVKCRRSAHPHYWQTCKLLHPWALFHETYVFVYLATLEVARQVFQTVFKHTSNTQLQSCAPCRQHMPATFKQAALWPHSSSFFRCNRCEICQKSNGENHWVRYLCLISLWEMFMGYHGSWKCPVDVTYLPALALCKQISDISMDKKLGQMKWNIMMEKLLLWILFYAQIYTEGRAWYG